MIGSMMKRIVTLLNLMLFMYSTGISAHEAMFALYADPSASSCQAILPELTMIDLSLFYVRGDGPAMGPTNEFRIQKSNDDIQIGWPAWSEELGLVAVFGSLESGITVAYNMGEQDRCREEDYVFLAIIPITNISDPDTFTISIVDRPRGKVLQPTISITLCEEPYPIYEVLGGTFVFNGTCASPENPFQDPTPVQSSTWGAIKGLYKD